MSIEAVQFIAAVRKYLDEKVGFRDNYCAGGAGEGNCPNRALVE